MKERNIKKTEGVFLVAGLLMAGFLVLPYFLLGQGSFVEVHDQLDGEVVNYMYQAKYFLKPGPIHEFMNGMGKAAMLPPAPLGVLFYKVFSPFIAFALMHVVEVFVAFLSMFFLCRRMELSPMVSTITGVLFSYMPFYPVYGLSAYGQPLLVLCFWRLMQNKKDWKAMLGISFVAVFSSFSLVGYAFVALGTLLTLTMFVARKKENGFGSLIATGVLLVSYIITNGELLQTVTGGGYTTHRTEMVLKANENLALQFKELFLKGGAYSKVYAPLVLLLTALLIISFLYKKKIAKESDLKDTNHPILKHIRTLKVLYLLVIIFTVLAVLWNSDLIVKLRIGIGGPLPYFQADRIYWCFPFIWMLILGNGLEALKPDMKIRKITARKVFGMLAMLVCTTEFLLILRDSSLNKNLRLLFLKNYRQTTWESIYMDDVFSEMEQQLSKDKDSYSVVSLGIHPSVALYHGFTCADGYSNNYDVEYKHKFRNIIAEELEEAESFRSYYDDWGNRVYLCAAPFGFNGVVGKEQGGVYESPKLNLQAMKDMNIRYIFSAAPIVWEEGENAPVLLREEPFTSETAYYAIWVYEIK